MSGAAIIVAKDTAVNKTDMPLCHLHSVDEIDK